MWASLTGLVAEALLTVGTLSGEQDGALTALQTMAVIIALPFSFVMVLMMIATLRAFKGEWADIDRERRDERQHRLTAPVVPDERPAAR